MTIERPWVRPSGSAAGERLAEVSIKRRMLAGKLCNALPRHLQQAEPIRDLRNVGISNVGIAAVIRLIGIVRKCNFV
jgi:hypothetical protein